MKFCRFCHILLVPGKNWYPSDVAISQYRCSSCWQAYRRLNEPNSSRSRGRGRKLKMCTVHPECANIDRLEVLRRGDGLCGICRKSRVRRRWHMDHIIPVSKGGIHCYENLQPSHIICNLRKGNRV